MILNTAHLYLRNQHMAGESSEDIRLIFPALQPPPLMWDVLYGIRWCCRLKNICREQDFDWIKIGISNHIPIFTADMKKSSLWTYTLIYTLIFTSIWWEYEHMIPSMLIFTSISSYIVPGHIIIWWGSYLGWESSIHFHRHGIWRMFGFQWDGGPCEAYTVVPCFDHGIYDFTFT